MVCFGGDPGGVRWFWVRGGGAVSPRGEPAVRLTVTKLARWVLRDTIERGSRRVGIRCGFSRVRGPGEASSGGKKRWCCGT